MIRPLDCDKSDRDVLARLDVLTRRAIVGATTAKNGVVATVDEALQLVGSARYNVYMAKARNVAALFEMETSFTSTKIPEEGRVLTDRSLLRLYPACDGMMHDECMVGIGGTPLHWGRAVRDVPDEATLHETVYQRLAIPRVRNFTSYGPYRPAALRNHSKAKKFYDAQG